MFQRHVEFFSSPYFRFCAAFIERTLSQNRVCLSVLAMCVSVKFHFDLCCWCYCCWRTTSRILNPKCPKIKNRMQKNELNTSRLATSADAFAIYYYYSCRDKRSVRVTNFIGFRWDLRISRKGGGYMLFVLIANLHGGFAWGIRIKHNFNCLPFWFIFM